MSEIQKTVSVILTNYNHAKFVEQALESVQQQTYNNIELIMIDDASTDGSQAILQDYQSSRKSRFPTRLILLNENKGKWNALNRAIREATGELITLQDADDVSCPQRIERQVKCLEENRSLHNLCLFHHCYSQEDVDRNSKYQTPVSAPLAALPHHEVLSNVYQGFKTPGINHYYIGAKWEAHGATCLFYKQLWDHGMKFLPGNLGLRCQKAEDSDFNTKVTLLLQKTSILLEPLYCYRRNTSTNGAWLEGL